MSDIIVSDTTSLIVLEKLHKLDLLAQLFDRILLPEVVMDEIRQGSPNQGRDVANCDCFEVVSVTRSKRLEHLLTLLDTGEAHAIELATTRRLPLIVDERKGRDIAQQLGIKVTGFAGLLILSRRRHLLTVTEANNLLLSAIENGLYLADALLRQVQENLERG